MVWFHGYAALVRVLIAMVEKSFALGILWLIRNMEGSLVLALFAEARVEVVDCAMLPYQEWFP